MQKKELATKRIPITPSAFEQIREFCRGLDVSYSDGLNFLLNSVMEKGEDAHGAGRRLRDDVRATKNIDHALD